MLDLASHIVKTKSGHFDPSHFDDRYENALTDLLKKKQAGEKIVPIRGAPPPRVVNIMDALRASVDAERKKAPAPSTQARRPAKKKVGSRPWRSGSGAAEHPPDPRPEKRKEQTCYDGFCGGRLPPSSEPGIMTPAICTR